MLHPGCKKKKKKNQTQLSLQFCGVLPMLCITEQICSQNWGISLPSLSLSNKPFLFHPNMLSRASSSLPSLPPPPVPRILHINCRAVSGIRLLHHHSPPLGFLKAELNNPTCRFSDFFRSPGVSSMQLTALPVYCYYHVMKHCQLICNYDFMIKRKGCWKKLN